NIAWNLLHTGKPFLKTEVGLHQTLYFSQPPPYFALLAVWYVITGATANTVIDSARLLAVIMSVFALVFIFLFLQRKLGPWALLPTLFVAVDGWIVFSDRISWIDNTAIPLGVAGLWIFDQGLQHRKRSRLFVIAGVLLVTAALFKYLAIYF